MTKIRFYKLEDGHTVLIKEPNALIKWAQWYENADKTQARLIDVTNIAPYIVSTVFLGLDNNFMAEGPPILFETILMNQSESFDIARCSTFEQAQQQHLNMVERIREIVGE